ncbi:fimbrial protein [Parabacteroides sp. APC149_11_2_Y6]
MNTKLQGLCPSIRPVQALAASVYLLAAVLLASCTSESDKTNRTSTDEADSTNKREVLISFKNKLTVKTTKAETKAETKADAPIATEAENEIATLDVYVFGAKVEGDAYTFRERFSYRQDGSALPTGAKELDLTPSVDNATTTALLELQKGLFVRLYCIANQTELMNPTDGTPVADTYFTPLTYDMETGVLTDGTPSEKDFCKFHSPLLTATSEALGLPLPMTGAQTTPIDLTDFSSSARVQVGFKLTRTMARFDVSNIEKDSKFHLESISMGNGRKGTTFFPVKVYGAAPAAEGELITYPACAFEGEKANEGLQVSAFYSYPSLLEDKGYLILNGTYQVNKTEVKDVSYQIPFIQQTTDGGEVALEINNNHRYTIGITKADEYHLDFTLDVAEWDEGGSLDDYDPNAGTDSGEATITIAEALKDKISYNADTRTVTMNTLNDGDNFTVEVETTHEPEIKKTYSGSATAQQYDWLEVSAATPVTKAPVSGYQYTISINPDYNGDEYPKAVIRFVDKVSGSETVVAVSTPLGKPVLSSSATVVLNAAANNEVPELIIEGQCAGGSTLDGPAWLTYETADTDEENFSYKVKLVPSKEGFPESLPTAQTLTITNKSATNMKTTVTVSFSEADAWIAEDINGYETTHHDAAIGYRVNNTANKTLTVSFYSMFAPVTSEILYDTDYCNSTNGDNTWLNNSKLAKTEIAGNRRKYTYNIVVNKSTGTDAAYQLHKATIKIKQNGNELKSYTIWRGASYVGYPIEDGSALYYSAVEYGGLYWAPVNCGAKQISKVPTSDGVAGNGYLYQWGRNQPFTYGNSSDIYSGSDWPSTLEESREPPYAGKFIKQNNSNGLDWLKSGHLDGLWTFTKGSTNTNNPCPKGWRIPAQTGDNSGELDKLVGKGTNNGSSNNRILTIPGSNGLNLVLPAAGCRFYSNGSSSDQGSYGYYWSSSVPSGNSSARLVNFSNATFNQNTFSRAYGFSVRCLQE